MKLPIVLISIFGFYHSSFQHNDKLSFFLNNLAISYCKFYMKVGYPPRMVSFKSQEPRQFNSCIIPVFLLLMKILQPLLAGGILCEEVMMSFLDILVTMCPFFKILIHIGFTRTIPITVSFFENFCQVLLLPFQPIQSIIN